MKNIQKICKLIKNLTEEDFNEGFEICKDQQEYLHPLKHGEQSKFNQLGNYNFRVITALKNIKDILDNPPDFIKK